jgi:hypothetical protein
MLMGEFHRVFRTWSPLLYLVRDTPILALWPL